MSNIVNLYESLIVCVQFLAQSLEQSVDNSNKSVLNAAITINVGRLSRRNVFSGTLFFQRTQVRNMLTLQTSEKCKTETVSSYLDL